MKLFTLLAVSVLSLPVFAQQTCYVDMVDRYNRVVATFSSYDDPNVCYEGMKECRKAIRLRPELGGVDCVRDTPRPYPQPQPNPGPRPNPNPGPRPNPNPGPRPNPNPNPYPNPYPGPQYGVEATSLILDLQNAESAAEKKTKLMKEMILQMNSPSLVPFVRICDGTRTWSENAQCLLDGVQRAPREMIPEQLAINVVGDACKLTSTWSNEKMCFSSAFNGGRFQSLNYYAQSCSQMYNAESAAKCYRQVFGVN